MRDRELESFRHHADDRRERVADLHGLPPRCTVAGEARPPHVVAEDDDRRRAGRFVAPRRARVRSAAVQKRRRKPDAVISATCNRPRVVGAGDQVARDVAIGAEVGDGLSARDARRRSRRALAAPRCVAATSQFRISTMRSPPGSGSVGFEEHRRHHEGDRADPDGERHRQPADDRQPRILHEHPERRA